MSKPIGPKQHVQATSPKHGETPAGEITCKTLANKVKDVVSRVDLGAGSYPSYSKEATADADKVKSLGKRI